MHTQPSKPLSKETPKQTEPFDSVVILGPTATGKTKLAVAMAKACSGEIISADSRQVYRGLDIGSGKDIEEYGQVPYHLIDVVEPTTEFSLFDFLQATNIALGDICSRGQLPIIAGGTGLYLDALLRGYSLSYAPEDSELRAKLTDHSQQQLNDYLLSLKTVHNTTDTEDRERTIRAIEIALAEQGGTSETVQVNLDPIVIGLKSAGEALRSRIKARLDLRLEAGMIEEVQSLVDRGVSWQQLYNFGLEYRFIAELLQGKLNLNDMKQKLASSIYQFARQQIKWFRRMERQGIKIHWLEADNHEPEQAIGLVEDWLIDQRKHGRNFDSLKQRFNQNIYGTPKGKLRLDLLSEDFREHIIPRFDKNLPSVLDVGCGEARISQSFIEKGCVTTLLDISEDMLSATKARLQEEKIDLSKTHWLAGSLQDKLPAVSDQFDLIIAHAVLEWMDKPLEALELILSKLKPGGVLSLAYYNLNSLIYRNLLQGNFRKLKKGDWEQAKGGLTPTHPIDPEDLEAKLAERNLSIINRRGIRTFYDFLRPDVRNERSYSDVLEMERTYSQKEPFLSLARYIHVVAVYQDTIPDK